MISTSDPDAGLVSKGGLGSRPAYHHHRAVDDAQGVITAGQTTSGSIAENKKLMDLVQQPEQNTQCQPKVVVADHKYGTRENYLACPEKGLVTHLGDAKAKATKVGAFLRRLNSSIKLKRTPVWRRLWRQQIQDYLIAAIQNIRLLLARTLLKPAASAAGRCPTRWVSKQLLDFLNSEGYGSSNQQFFGR